MSVSEIRPIAIEDELKHSYLDYAMSVIVSRALPDVRDGLKPVHRRVLFAMHELGNDYNKAYKKSARVVGDVIGKYHPHGDSAVYETIVRMAQDFSLRYMLVDGQGNFGSVDGDSAAAMRYTEVRMQKLTHEILADLEKDTVDWEDNYDGSERIPQVMPTRIPNLLINGTTGIAVGMATNMAPHNMTEVVNKNWLLDLDYQIISEDPNGVTLVIEKESDGIKNFVLFISPSILIMEQYIFELKQSQEEILTRLLQKNRDIVHGAFVLDDTGKKVIFRDTLQTENLDKNELLASLNALSLLLSEFSNEIITFSR